MAETKRVRGLRPTAPRGARKRFAYGKTLAQGQFICPGANEMNGVPGPWNTDWGVKGHADNPYNNRCDEMAVAEWQKRKG